VNKSRKIRWVVYVARMEGVEVLTEFWLEGPKGTDHWEYLGVAGRITLRWTLGRQKSMGRTGFSWLRIGSNGGLL